MKRNKIKKHILAREKKSISYLNIAKCPSDLSEVQEVKFSLLEA